MQFICLSCASQISLQTEAILSSTRCLKSAVPGSVGGHEAIPPSDKQQEAAGGSRRPQEAVIGNVDCRDLR
jgi:hypothetical protein